LLELLDLHFGEFERLTSQGLHRWLVISFEDDTCVAEPLDVIDHHICHNSFFVCAFARYNMREDPFGLVASHYETFDGLALSPRGLDGLVIHVHFFPELYACFGHEEII
jgi:hypothetical protein